MLGKVHGTYQHIRNGNIYGLGRVVHNTERHDEDVGVAGLSESSRGESSILGSSFDVPGKLQTGSLSEWSARNHEHITNTSAMARAVRTIFSQVDDVDTSFLFMKINCSFMVSDLSASLGSQ